MSESDQYVRFTQTQEVMSFVRLFVTNKLHKQLSHKSFVFESDQQVSAVQTV